jgi:ATP-dependent Clp protease ATP-binding subunit ClpC
MFERYTEVARRAIFFARYDASMLGSPYIETEHLLLGLLREDRSFRNRLPAGAAEQIRKRIEERVSQPVQRISTSVDMPLSQDCKRALACAAEESAAQRQAVIDCCHLLVGLLRIETSAAAVLLREFGIEYASYRESLAEPPASPPLPESAPAGPLGKTALDLEVLLATASHLEDKGGRLKRAGWTRKEALGHLIDWAAAHHQCVRARAHRIEAHRQWISRR